MGEKVKFSVLDVFYPFAALADGVGEGVLFSFPTHIWIGLR
jgi:hypothetical protein